MKPKERQYLHQRCIDIAHIWASASWIDAHNAQKNDITRKAWYVVVLDRETDKLFNILVKEVNT